MRKVLISETVNIDDCPIKQEFSDVTNISIGDLHGNALKLLFFLIHEGVFQITPADYAEIVLIYKTPVEQLTLKHINVFNNIIEAMPVLYRNILLRLIGDEFCDRGSNDYFTLKILSKLHHERIPLEILISNHGIGFIEAYEANSSFIYENLSNFNTSINNLQRLIEKNLVSRKDVFAMIEFYKPKLKAISYSLNMERNSITIYSHAPIDIEIIQLLAKKFNVPFTDNNPKELSQTIDAINYKFKEFIKTNRLHTLYNREMLGFEQQNRTATTDPIELITWNRDYKNLNRLETHKSYPVEFVHGHDLTAFNQSHIFNLDNMLGKSADHHKEKYEVLISSEVGSHPDTQKKISADALSSPSVPLEQLPELYELLHLSEDESSDDYEYSPDSSSPAPKQFQATEPVSQRFSSLPYVQELTPVQRRVKALFFLELQLLANKRDEFLLRHEDTAYEIALKLHAGLKDAAEKYLGGKADQANYLLFKESANQQITAARPELETHRGYKKILDNIALAIDNILQYFGFIKIKNPNYHFFSTDSKMKIDAIEKCINVLKPENNASFAA